MILECLPTDILEAFDWRPRNKFSPANLLTLLQKQRKMKRLQVVGLNDADFDDTDLKKLDAVEDSFKCCSSLAYYGESHNDMKLCNLFLRNAKELEELTIHVHTSDLPGRSMSARELNDSAARPGFLTRTVFGHMLPFEECTPLAHLTTLNLYNVHLRQCAQTYCRVVDLTSVRALRVVYCRGADSLIAELSKSRHLPRKLEIFDFRHKDDFNDDGVAELESLLCLTSGIRQLTIDLGTTSALPKADSIIKHGKTLKLLNVHAYGLPLPLVLNPVTPGGYFPPLPPPNPIIILRDDSSTATSPSRYDVQEFVWSEEDFGTICESAKELEQLSCAFPKTEIFANSSISWMSFADHVFALRSLVTLNISSWPVSKTDDTDNSRNLLPARIYDHLLQAYAQRIFKGSIRYNAFIYVSGRSTPSTEPEANASNNAESSPSEKPQDTPSRLRLVAFGSLDKLTSYLRNRSQRTFYRSELITSEGHRAVHAVPIKRHLLKYIEPRSEVLDLVRSWSPKRPGGAWSESGSDTDDF